MNKKSLVIALIFAGQTVDVVPAPYTQGKIKITVAELKKAIVSYDDNYSKSRNSDQGSLKEITMLIKEISHKELNRKGTETPLMVASERGMVEVTRILLANGALPGVKDKNGHDALWFAQHACKSAHCKEVAEMIKDSHHKAKAKKEHKKAHRTTKENKTSKPTMHMPA